MASRCILVSINCACVQSFIACLCVFALRHMRDLVALCLQRDPKLRPSAGQLLTHRFFKQARDKAYLAKTLLFGM